jgi:hypothetical protein
LRLQHLQLFLVLCEQLTVQFIFNLYLLLFLASNILDRFSEILVLVCLITQRMDQWFYFLVGERREQLTVLLKLICSCCNLFSIVFSFFPFDIIDAFSAFAPPVSFRPCSTLSRARWG